jgi:hypothetical protein
MKLLAVLGSDGNYAVVSRRVKPLGFETVRYRHVVKAMDNIDEINPDAIIVSARDFPRHWKIFVQFIRAVPAPKNCPIIVLKTPDFSDEESSKASFLGVSCLVNDNLDNPAELEDLLKILSRHIKVNERRLNRRFFVEPWFRFGFMFARPQDKLIVPCELVTISIAGISCKPAGFDLIKGLYPGMELAECSLRLGSAIFSPICRLVRIDSAVSIEFVSFPDGGKQILEQYLEGFSA